MIPEEAACLHWSFLVTYRFFVVLQALQAVLFLSPLMRGEFPLEACVGRFVSRLTETKAHRLYFSKCSQRVLTLRQPIGSQGYVGYLRIFVVPPRRKAMDPRATR